MRKHLLRIVFDQLWHFESVGNELLVGYGWAISMISLCALIGTGILWKTTKDLGQVVSSLIFWCLIPVALVLVPLLKLPIADSGIPLFGYGVMLAIGFFSATLLAGRRAKTVGLNPDIIWDLMTWILIPGIVGARIVYLTQYGDRVFQGKQGIEIIKAAVALWDGGIVFYGCVIGGVLGILAYCKKSNIRPLQLLDVIMPSVFVGLGFGRIGCFLYGCCFGAVCTLPWAVQFPQDSMTFQSLEQRSRVTEQKLLKVDGVPVTAMELADAKPDSKLSTIALHPTQLYSSALAFLLAGILSLFFRRRPFEGAVTGLGAILYPINRFVLEIIRDDEPGQLGTSLTISQWLSIALFVLGLVLMLWLQKNGTTRDKFQEPN